MFLISYQRIRNLPWKNLFTVVPIAFKRSRVGIGIFPCMQNVYLTYVCLFCQFSSAGCFVDCISLLIRVTIFLNIALFTHFVQYRKSSTWSEILNLNSSVTMDGVFQNFQLRKQMSVSPSVCHRNPSASQNHAYQPYLSQPVSHYSNHTTQPWSHPPLSLSEL